jgi:uncharacterized protein (TIGR03067 family)
MLAIISVALAMSATARGADEQKVSGTVLKVDAPGRTLTIAPDAGGRAKALDLEVSRKAKITVDGGEASLDSLRVGQRATVTYDAGLGVATAVEATGKGEAAPTIHHVAELNTPGQENALWPSPDGLTMYGVSQARTGGEGEIWSATRKDHDSLFGPKRTLGRGRHVTVSGDGLTMFLVLRRADGRPGDSIHVTTRRTIDEPFGRPQEVAELRSVEAPRQLALSADGRTLYFNHGSGRAVALSAVTRISATARWSAPKPVPLAWPGGVERSLLGVFPTADGLSLYGVVGERTGPANDRFTVWTRKAADKPFSDPMTLGLPEVKEFTGWNPRLVESSHELFFCSQRLSPDGDVDIWLVRDFRPIPAVTPKAGSPPWLEGSWLAVAEEAKGRRITHAEVVNKRKMLKVEEDRFTLSTTDYRIVGTIRHAEAEGDGAVDMDGRYVEGGGGKAVMLRGIYEVRNGTLRLCYSYSDTGQPGERPSSFETEEDRPDISVTFRKEER